MRHKKTRPPIKSSIRFACLALALLAGLAPSCNLPGTSKETGPAAAQDQRLENGQTTAPDNTEQLSDAVDQIATEGSAPTDPTAASVTEALPTPHPWDGKSRVTILVMGLDYGDWESADRTGPPRSDTMILFTIDPQAGTAGMLSIPRDLWVSMPGIEGNHKINTAYRFGELYQMPGGGPGLALRTVEELLAVPVNFYAVVDFFAFEDFIDELGGVELDVPGAIKVDPIGPDNTVQLEPGLQVLDGPTTLAYARNRSTAGDETDRAARQQQVILAIRDRVLDLNMLPRLVLRAPILYGQLQDGIDTNMTLEQAIRLAWLAQEISLDDIQRAAIGDREVTYDFSPDGQAIFVPIPERITALRNEIFGAEGETAAAPSTAALIAAENSRITLYNETGQPDLGDRTAAYLVNKGLNVIQVVRDEDIRTKTRLVDHAGDPYTMRALIDLLHVSPAEIYIQYDPQAGTEFSIYLGLDWAENHSLEP